MIITGNIARYFYIIAGILLLVLHLCGGVFGGVVPAAGLQTKPTNSYPYDGTEDVKIGVIMPNGAAGCTAVGSILIARAAHDVNTRNSTYCPAISKLKNPFTMGTRILDTEGAPSHAVRSSLKFLNYIDIRPPPAQGG